MNRKNVKEVIENDLCNYCATCTAICSTQALTLGFNENGYEIDLNNDVCVNCGLCLEVCSGKQINNYFKKNEQSKENYYIGEYLSLYSGYSNNFNIRYSGASGGVLTELISYLLANNIVDQVILTKFDSEDPLKPVVFPTNNVEEVMEAQGSKYSPVPLCEILKNLDFSKKYIVVALPCHLQGIANYCALKKIDTSNIIKLGLFCSRTNHLKATKKLLQLNKVNIPDIQSIKYRGNGHPGRFQIDLKNGKKKYICHLDRTYWSNLFKKYYMNYRCWLCPDKTAFYSDISFADDWLVPFHEDKLGCSLVVVRTDTGQNIINRLIEDKKITLNPKDEHYVVHGQALEFKMNIRQRIKIAKFLNKKLPVYKNFNFKKEKNSLINEIFMFFRIIFVKTSLIDTLISIDEFIYKQNEFRKELFQTIKVLIRRKY